MRILSIFLLAFAAYSQVTYDRLLKAPAEPQNWLTYWGDYAGHRHRNLTQITPANVQNLRMEWMFQTGVPGAFQTVPLVIDNILYFTVAGGKAFAVDGPTGRQLWRYDYKLPKGLLSQGTINRGFAVLGDKLYMLTPDAHVLCLDMRNGALVWDVAMEDNEKGYAGTVAPLAIKDKILVGVAGGEYGIRGFVDAYDAKTGKRVWRTYTIPSKEEPGGDTWAADSWKRGGGPTWLTGTYDPELNLVYWPTGNPGPDLHGPSRLGDNLYSCSMLALDVDTGKMKWYFQFTPHDTHDWDANETPVFINAEFRGKPRKLLVQANRNAFYYILDRVTGEFLFAKPYAKQNWAKGIDDKGRPEVIPGKEPSAEGTDVCPGLTGGSNWMAPSYNPALNTLFVQVREACDTFYTAPPVYAEGKAYWGSVFRSMTNEKDYGRLLAMDPLTGTPKWEFRYNKPPWAGTLSTASNLVFAGDEDGYLIALDATNGKLLWKFNTGNAIKTAPITYSVNGKQYVAIASGAGLLVFTLP
ncbi:MAG: PQQ-dependent dehydrogenase, methanol/ethanol family [Bryobacter sp.]|nr:PQQ-dependent dehydrogenase, methanol/ethanol family [Bryobacter sp.]